jgi:hypothetical protein
VFVAERDFVDALLSVLPSDTEVLLNDRSLIAPAELDVVFPAARVAIEFNGVWWHGEAAGRTRHVHEDKMLAVRGQGYTLVTVWEDTWRLHRDAVLSMLETKLGVSRRRRVFARKLEFRELASRDARLFLDANHIQGAVSATHHFALFEGEEPVAVMSVRSPSAASRTRRDDGVWEIVRYATSVQVVGGFSKLLVNAERRLLQSGVTLTQWVSFSDNEVSDGRLYERCGFVLDGELGPDYRYCGRGTGGVRRPKEAFQKSRFREDASLDFEEGLTEGELAELNGLWRCWDCGKRRWMRDVVRD